MAVLPIRIMGDPCSTPPPPPVGEITDEVRQLVADMFETMDAAPGVGLAAPQVGVPLRIYTYSYPDDDGAPVARRAHQSRTVDDAAGAGRARSGRRVRRVPVVPRRAVPASTIGAASWSPATISTAPASRSGWTGGALASCSTSSTTSTGSSTSIGSATATGRPCRRSPANAAGGARGQSWTPGVDDIDA